MGKNLGQSVDAYNKAVGSLELRVLPAARRFKEMGAAGGDEIETLDPVDKVTRAVDGGEPSSSSPARFPPPAQRQAIAAAHVPLSVDMAHPRRI